LVSQRWQVSDGKESGVHRAGHRIADLFPDLLVALFLPPGNFL
jgi:hypothetical protein